MEICWERFIEAGIFSDDIPKTMDGFIAYMVQNRTIWFEVIRVSDEAHIGFVYFSDFLPSWTEKRYISCSFHSIVWDHKATPRRELVLDVIQWVFNAFGIHRMFAAIPLRFGAAIRIAKKFGFVEEGVLRGARRYNGQWYGVLILSILESELGNGRV